MVKSALLAFAAAIIIATPASAAAVPTAAYLSRTGSGTTCTFSSPCNNMADALSVAGAGGHVVCLDRGVYGTPIITQPVTISCGEGLWVALAAAFVRITTAAGADVAIEGLVMDELGLFLNGIVFDGQGSLHLRNVRVGNLVSGGHGVNFAPNGPATLHVSDSVFYNIAGGSGILVKPTGSGSANVHLRNVKVERALHGVFADGTASTVGVNVNISDSLFAENSGNGIGALSSGGAAAVTVTVKDSHISGNFVNGLGALGAAASGAGSATIAVGSSMISANVNGVATSSAGQIRTFGNNQVISNANNGTFTGTVGLQ